MSNDEKRAIARAVYRLNRTIFAIETARTESKGLLPIAIAEAEMQCLDDDLTSALDKVRAALAVLEDVTEYIEEMAP